MFFFFCDADDIQYKASRISCAVVGSSDKLTLSGFLLHSWNPSMRGDSPQQWSQQQTQSGDTEDQQVHLNDKDTQTHNLFFTFCVNSTI